MHHKIFSIPKHSESNQKKQRKLSFRDEFLKNPILQNFRGTSYLHQAAKQKLFKEMARLIYYGADVKMTDVVGATAFCYLSADENERVTQLQSQLSKLMSALTVNNVDLISRHIFNFNSPPRGKSLSFNFFHDKYHRYRILTILQRLNDDPLLQPLFEILKLSFLGLHDLSTRPKFHDSGYDSDDDVKEATSFQQYLSVEFDADSESVESLVHAGRDGLAGEACGGLYDNKNQIFVGAKISLPRTIEKILTIFLHEVTHFICNEVFLNECKPYYHGDSSQAEACKEMIQNLKRKINTGDVTIKIFKDIFKFYPEQSYVSELIARTTELLFDDHSKQLLRQQTPELLLFYENNFLPAVKKHAVYLEERALSGWPKSCLKAKL